MGVSSVGSASSVATSSSGATYHTAITGGGNPCAVRGSPAQKAGGAAAFSTADASCVEYEDISSQESYPGSSGASSVATDSSGAIYHTATTGGGNPRVQGSPAQKASGAAAFSAADVSCFEYEDVTSGESYPGSSSALQASPAHESQGSPISSPARTSGGDWYYRAHAFANASPSSQATDFDLPGVLGP